VGDGVAVVDVVGVADADDVLSDAAVTRWEVAAPVLVVASEAVADAVDCWAGTPAAAAAAAASVCGAARLTSARAEPDGGSHTAAAVAATAVPTRTGLL
jgi:hypothetical protein